MESLDALSVRGVRHKMGWLSVISYWYVLKITLVVCAYAAITVGGALALAKIAQWMLRKRGVLSYVVCFVALVMIASLVLWLAMLGGELMR